MDNQSQTVGARALTSTLDILQGLFHFRLALGHGLSACVRMQCVMYGQGAHHPVYADITGISFMLSDTAPQCKPKHKRWGCPGDSLKNPTVANSGCLGNSARAFPLFSFL